MRFPSRQEGQGAAAAASRHTGRAGQARSFPSGQSQRSAGAAGSTAARDREKIAAARRPGHPVDGQAKRGTLPRPGRRTPHSNSPPRTPRLARRRITEGHRHHGGPCRPATRHERRGKAREAARALTRRSQDHPRSPFRGRLGTCAHFTDMVHERSGMRGSHFDSGYRKILIHGPAGPASGQFGSGHTVSLPLTVPDG